ncbi:hypothetical protein [Chryseobacterium sp.]|uniref:hypothetical protein n=1 Tax=Chryseobacterium sp. TaxID=1871047 RepID=UPI0025BB15ED|nr:hypothetical protein [Chryseobacterium sp.]
MRNYIVYFLTSLFLFFIVESRIHVNVLHSNSTQHTSHLPQKANRLNQTFEKLSIQQIVDNTGENSSLELSEDDFQLSDILQTIVVFASVFTLTYILGLLKYKRLKPVILGFLSDFSTVKKFILIRSIRI